MRAILELGMLSPSKRAAFPPMTCLRSVSVKSASTRKRSESSACRCLMFVQEHQLWPAWRVPRTQQRDSEGAHDCSARPRLANGLQSTVGNDVPHSSHGRTIILQQICSKSGKRQDQRRISRAPASPLIRTFVPILSSLWLAEVHGSRTHPRPGSWPSNRFEDGEAHPDPSTSRGKRA
jgi:hypothetical protein